MWEAPDANADQRRDNLVNQEQTCFVVLKSYNKNYYHDEA